MPSSYRGDWRKTRALFVQGQITKIRGREKKNSLLSPSLSDSAKRKSFPRDLGFWKSCVCVRVCVLIYFSYHKSGCSVSISTASWNVFLIHQVALTNGNNLLKVQGTRLHKKKGLSAIIKARQTTGLCALGLDNRLSEFSIIFFHSCIHIIVTLYSGNITSGF